jgi:hypothetical protein
MNAAERVDELRARRAARAADRAALEERREYGLKARHAAKLAHLAERERKKAEEAAKETTPDTPAPESPAPESPEPDVA